jgi:isocitrate/isopropylmalate dehydrogenase
MSNLTPITVAHGDGIGPEIMAATLPILQESGARLAIEEIEIGEKEVFDEIASECPDMEKELDLRYRRGCVSIAGDPPARALRGRRFRFHQDREPQHVRRQGGLPAWPGRIA